MKFRNRIRTGEGLPGVVGTLRSDRRTASLVPRLEPGDIALINHHDVDRQTAQALLDSGVSAVLNEAPLLSGRYPALGPSVLVEAGIPVLDSLGAQAANLSDGQRVRIDESTVFAAGQRGEELAVGRPVDVDLLDVELTRARDGLADQLESFTHNSSELLRREQELLLQGQGLPTLQAQMAERPVVVVVPGRDHAAELKSIRRFIREQDPVVIAVDGEGVAAVRAAGHQPHVVIIDGTAGDEDRPALSSVRKATDLVVVLPRGAVAATGGTPSWERLGLQPLVIETAALAEDIALLLADQGEAEVIVGVGMHATLHDFLDRRRAGLASTYLTRLRVGERLVDARSVPTMYSGRVRPRHVAAVSLAGLVAVIAAIATTPVGQGWANDVKGAVPWDLRLDTATIHDAPGGGPQ